MRAKQLDATNQLFGLRETQTPLTDTSGGGTPFSSAQGIHGESESSGGTATTFLAPGMAVPQNRDAKLVRYFSGYGSHSEAVPTLDLNRHRRIPYARVRLKRKSRAR